MFLRILLCYWMALIGLFGKSQPKDADHLNDIPIFKQITHPFMPPITSEYFFFSEDGLMWFSTARGLTSFDGSDVIYYSSLSQSNKLGLSRIFAMTEDKNHNFYIGTPTGLYYYDRVNKAFDSVLYTYKDNHQTSASGIDALYLDKDGKLYAGSGNGGLFVYDRDKKQIDHYNLDVTKPDSWQDRQFNTISSFASHATDRDKLWVGTFHGIYLFDKKEKKFSQDFGIITNLAHRYNANFANDRQLIDVARMDVANDSLIWFNSWAGGFAKYNTRTGKASIVFGRDALYKAKDVYMGYVITKFVALPGEKYLLGIYNGKTAIYDVRTTNVTYFNVSQNDFTEEETRYVDKDPKGNIWLLQRGLLYAAMPVNRKLQTVEVANLTQFDFSKPILRGVYFDTINRLFYCAFLGSIGIHIYDTNFVRQKVIATSLINNYYNLGSTVDTKIAKDGSGRFWVIGWKTHLLLPGQKSFEPVEKQFSILGWLGSEGQFSDIASTRDGNILLKKQDGTVYQVNHVNLSVDTIRCPGVIGEPVDINNNSSWYDSKRDLIYLGSANAIAQYDRAKKEMKIIPGSSLFGGHFLPGRTYSSTLDDEGRVWLIIPKYGIRIIDPLSLACTDSISYGDAGLMRGDYTDITGSTNHRMLFRSQNGIVIYDYVKKQSFLFDHSNGLSSPNNKSFLHCNGYVFIGQGSSRFEYFKLSNLDDYSSTITPYLNSVFADTINVFTRTGFEKNQSIDLPYYQNSLAFSFSAPEFFLPERVEYAYQLKPVEKEWQYTNYFNRKIVYSRLSPGKYTFLVRSQMQGGNWNTKAIMYTIIISPAWWQSGWFRLLCIIIAAAIIIYIIQRRIQLIRKTEKERSRHEKELLELEARALRAQMNPHFIFNSLNSIKSLINRNENDKSAEYLTTFSKLIRTLFQNSDKREISLYEELETCRLYTQLEKMRFGNKVEFVFDTDESLDLKDIKVPALILQPFIENAIWHGLVPKEEGGKVIVAIRNKDSSVECIIDDNGIGRELSKRYKAEYKSTHESKGIGLTKSRLELDKLLNDREDTIRVIDKKDSEGRPAGTTVIITFKER